MVLINHVDRSRSVLQYETEFTRLALYSSQFVASEQERCTRFLGGLRDSLRLPLVPFRLTDYAELVERAKLIENSLVGLPQQQFGDSGGGRRRFQGESSRSRSLLFKALIH